MEEFLSLTPLSIDSDFDYERYLTLLQNGCIRYDKSLKQKPSVASRAAYQHSTSEVDQEKEPEYADSGSLFGCIDMPADDFYRINIS